MQITVKQTEYTTVWTYNGVEITALGHYEGLPVNVKEEITKWTDY